jgi:hypothetical protein
MKLCDMLRAFPVEDGRGKIERLYCVTSTLFLDLDAYFLRALRLGEDREPNEPSRIIILIENILPRPIFDLEKIRQAHEPDGIRTDG